MIATCCYPRCAEPVETRGMAPTRGFCEGHYQTGGIEVGSLVCVGRRYVMGEGAGDPGEVVPDRDTGRVMRVERISPASKWGGPTFYLASPDDPDDWIAHSPTRVVRVPESSEAAR